MSGLSATQQRFAAFWAEKTAGMTLDEVTEYEDSGAWISDFMARFPSPPPYAFGSSRFPGLSKLTEEVGELGQILGKILGCGGLSHWDGDLTPRLLDELGDVRAAIEVFMDLNLDWNQRFTVSVREAQKKALFMEWHDAGDPTPGDGHEDDFDVIFGGAPRLCSYCQKAAHEGSCDRDIVGGAGPPCLVCGDKVHLDPDGKVKGHEAMGSADAHHAATLGDAP